MNVTYQRDVRHLEKSTHFRTFIIEDIIQIPEAQTIEEIILKGCGWKVYSQKGLNKIDSEVIYFPPETIIPFELSEELGVTKYLSKGKVKAIKMIGGKYRSEGFICSPEKVEKYKDYILQWNEPEKVGNFGCSTNSPYPGFDIYPKFDNIQNVPDIFEPKDIYWESEKIHGSNFRCINLNGEDVIGSHKLILKPGEGKFWELYKNVFKNEIPENFIFYGEICGPGVQKGYTYGFTNPTIIIFSIKQLFGNFIHPLEVVRICEEYNIPHVNFYKKEFYDYEKCLEDARKSSEYTTTHLREGIVLTCDKNPNVMTKAKSFDFLEKETRK